MDTCSGISAPYLSSPRREGEREKGWWTSPQDTFVEQTVILKHHVYFIPSLNYSFRE